VATQPLAGSPNPSSAAGTRVRRGLIGYLVGSFAGGLIGWLIDSAITNDPYAGIRIGIFLGGLSGALIGSGAGWPGIALMLSMVVCSAAGAVAALLIWKPDPGSFVGIFPTALGGMAGAFLGLALGAVLVRGRSKAPAPPA
jgi:hypothetical protein